MNFRQIGLNIKEEEAETYRNRFSVVKEELRTSLLFIGTKLDVVHHLIYIFNQYT